MSPSRSATPDRLPPMTEAEISAAVQKVWNSLPKTVLWRNNVGGMTSGGTSKKFVRFGLGGPGGSDLIGLQDGRFVAIEVKSEKGKFRPNQLEFLEKVAALGGIARVATQDPRTGKIIETDPRKFRQTP